MIDRYRGTAFQLLVLLVLAGPALNYLNGVSDFVLVIGLPLGFLSLAGLLCSYVESRL